MPFDSSTLSIDTSKVESDGSFFQRATKLVADSFSPAHSDTILKKTNSWGTSIKKSKFQDMDMLESGLAREYIAEDLLSPSQDNKKWSYSYLQRFDKTQYKLFDPDGKFLLSAKQEGTMFYISQYENFPELLDTPNENYCAVLKKTDDARNFKLYNCGCEGCDQSFGRYTCSNEDHEGADRQLLADITHSTKRIKHVDADMRCLTVILPAVMDDKRSRVIWCPRVCGNETPTGGTPRATAKKNLITSPSPVSKTHQFTFEEPVSDRTKIQSKLPEWNDQLHSLVLKFHGGRVQSASSKNFLLTEGGDEDRAILQFGKYSKGRFVLDYRYPMAPVQAFGIALSSMSWCTE